MTSSGSPWSVIDALCSPPKILDCGFHPMSSLSTNAITPSITKLTDDTHTNAIITSIFQWYIHIIYVELKYNRDDILIKILNF